MHFLKFPNSLWFWQAGSGTELQKTASLDAVITASVAETSVAFDASTSVIPFSVSAAYLVSISGEPFDQVSFELSAFTYTVSATPTKSILAYISANFDGVAPELFARLTATPIYTLVQSGQFNKSVEASYNISASAGTASIGSYLSVTGSYSLSASPDISASASDAYSVSAAYAITASTNILLNVTQGAVSKSVLAAYVLSASIVPTITVDRGGGFVWSRRKRRRLPIRIGFPLRD